MTRLFTSILLILALTLTGQSMAMARGASAATGQIVICTGTGPIAVFVDAQGQPTSAPMMCPDAALHVVVDAGEPHFGMPYALVVPAPAIHKHLAPVRPQTRHTPPSRAPPLKV